VLGVRVPVLDGALAPLAAVGSPDLQSSANRSGDPEARNLDEVDERVRAGVDVVLDGGELPGTPSTVLDLRGYEDAGTWTIVRHGAVPEAEIAACAS
jgi:L-threonylcarbamoyladenylate synthase